MENKKEKEKIIQINQNIFVFSLSIIILIYFFYGFFTNENAAGAGGYNADFKLIWENLTLLKEGIIVNLNNVISSFILNKPLRIYMSSYRGMVKKIQLQIIQFKKSDVYIDGLIINSTKNIGMINVDHHARKLGESNYNLKKLLILWSNMILNFSFQPFRMASIFGIILKLITKLIRKKNNKKQFEILEIKINA